MGRQRTVRVVIVSAALGLPFAVLWGWLLLVVAGRRSASGTSSAPLPAPMPAFTWGPFDLLVYAEPWFAGVIAFWLYVWGPIFAGWLCVSALLPVGPGSVARRRQLMMLGLVSLGFGVVFAAPWAYGLIRLLGDRGY